MSDLEKVFSRACLIGSSRPIQLRWEGAGDAIHARDLLIGLQARCYTGTTTPIKYHAVINVYEGETSPILAKAIENMATTAGTATDDQTYVVWRNVDVTRASRELTAQPIADIMFVRNIMVTDAHGHSLTGAGDSLLGIHKATVRNRANSLTDDGQLRIGMSGAPGLASVKQSSRMTMPAKWLFEGFDEILSEASGSGLTLGHGKNQLGRKDFDESEVMKNDGSSLGVKPTYYMTFMK